MMALTKGEIATARGQDDRGKSRVVQIRWPEKDLAELRVAFDALGLTLSSGVRMACKQWLRDQRP